MKIALHPMTPDETGFVFSTFEESIRVASTHVSGMKPADVTAMLYALIDRGWTVQVAESVDVPDLAVGWVCTGREPRQVAWMYVKPAFRGGHLGDQLLSLVGVPRWAKLVSPFSPNRVQPPRYNLVFRPYLVSVRPNT